MATVLVIEDDPALQEVLLDMLELEGHEVVLADDGQHALERLNDVRPSVILLDMMMPRMDGFRFAEELSRRGLRPGIPIIVITADGRAQHKAASIQAEGYIEKPFSMVKLLDEVSRVAG